MKEHKEFERHFKIITLSILSILWLIPLSISANFYFVVLRKEQDYIMKLEEGHLGSFSYAAVSCSTFQASLVLLALFIATMTFLISNKILFSKTPKAD